MRHYAYKFRLYPTGKLFGLRKFDLISTSKGVGFVKGKRLVGRFSLMDIFNQVIATTVNVKKATRLAARTTTLTVVGGGVSSPP